MSGFQEFSFGQNDSGIGNNRKRFKLDTGDKARISLAWWPTKQVNGLTVLDMDASPKFIRAQRHFMKGVGYFINNGPEFTRVAGEAPKLRVATVIVVWPMSRGALDKAAIKAGEFDVVPWVFDAIKWDTIKPIHEEWNLGEVDLTVACQDGQFQKMTFTPCKNSLLRDIMAKGSAASSLIERVVGEVQGIAANIGDEIGRQMTLDQIREKLSGGGGGGSSTPIGESSSTEDVDDLVDDILD